MQGIQIFQQVSLVVFAAMILTIEVNQIGTVTTLTEELHHSLVGGHKHRGHVGQRIVYRRCLVVGAILVPSRVEIQQVSTADNVTVGVSILTVASLVVQVAYLVDVVDSGASVLLSPGIVVAGHCGVLIGSAEIVKDMAEVSGLVVTAEHLSHIARRHDDVLHLMDITILAGDVPVDDGIVENVG